MKIADLFMGTSSGFATFATFTALPYAILNVQKEFAPYAGIKPDDRHYPFARPNQILTWHRETAEELAALFGEIVAKFSNRGAPSVSTLTDPSDARKVVVQ